MEKVTHKKPNSIWLFDYPSLASMEICQDRIVCLSERDINIIWQAVKDIDRFRSRVYLDVQGDEYTKASLEQFEEFQFWVSDLNVHLGDYDVCNELLERIADALEGMQAMSASSGNCGCIPGLNGGTAGTGTTSRPPSTQQTDETTREGDPPEGFETWDEYDDYKCRAADYIVELVKADLARASIVRVTELLALELAPLLLAVLLTPMPEVDLLLLAGLMVEAAAIALEMSLLISNIEDSKNDYVCALLSGTNVDSSIASVHSAIDDSIEADSGITGSILKYLGAKIIKTFFTIDNVNQLYEKSSIDYPDAECDCSTGALFEPIEEFGGANLISEADANPVVFEGVYVAGWDCTTDAREAVFNVGVPITVTAIARANAPSAGECSGTPIFHWYPEPDLGGTAIYIGSGLPQTDGPHVGVRSFWILVDSDGETPEWTLTYTVD